MLLNRNFFVYMLGDRRGAISPDWYWGGGFSLWAEQARPCMVEGAQAAVHPATERAVARRAGGVAVVPVRGPIFARPNIFEMFGLGTSAETIGRMATEAVGDPDVKAVVLDIDSPGGVTSGVPELAARIRGLRGDKPIIAHADFMAASAAYWIASAADEIDASPSALVGSIGAFILHLDFSEALKTEGITPTFIASAPEKVDGNQLQPLTESGTAELRALVDDATAMFVADVAAGRNVEAQAVRDDFGRGHIFTARRAARLGMVDRVRTLDETLAAYGVAPAAAQPSGRRGARALAARRRTREIALLENK